MGNNGFMTPNEIREFIGEPFGITTVEDPRMDDFYFNGQPLGKSLIEFDPQAANTVISKLEDDLLDVNDGVDDDTANKSNSHQENSPIQRAIKHLKRYRRGN